MRYAAALSIALTCGVMVSPKAIAHRAHIHYEETAAITLTADYGSHAPISSAEVLVYAPNQPDQPWLKGQTNNQGKFTFVPDRAIPGNWKVLVYDHGHGGEIIIPVTASTAIEGQEPAIAANPVEAINVESIHNDISASEDSNDLAAVAVTQTDTPIKSSGYPPYTFSQRLLMVASVVWGLTGTAMFFHKQDRSPSSVDS